MVDITALSAVLTGIKTAMDITKGAKDLRDASQMNTKIIELQGIISQAYEAAIDAQGEQLSLLREAHAMEAKITGRRRRLLPDRASIDYIVIVPGIAILQSEDGGIEDAGIDAALRGQSLNAFGDETVVVGVRQARCTQFDGKAKFI